MMRRDVKWWRDERRQGYASSDGMFVSDLQLAQAGHSVIAASLFRNK